MNCTHKFCAPLPDIEEVRSWYQGMHYFEMNCQHQGLVSIEASQEWDEFVASRMKIFNDQVAARFPLVKPLDIIEIGCLEGMFLKELSLQGHTVIGLESNAEVASNSSAINKIEIRVCDIESDNPKFHADAVLSFHTFEHLRDPREATAKAAQMLKPGGVLILELPCDDDEMNNQDHFHFFNERSLRLMMSEFFRNVQILPNSYLRSGRRKIGSLYAVGER